tara:strand:+ start:44 stop:457 length:414 start_codon:yes stop_codon:yes gene_type:complete
MPTVKPRVQVTLEPETHEVIERFARLQNRTRGAVIAELLNEIAPAIGRTISLLEAAQEAPNQVKAGLRAVAEGLQNEMVNATGEANRQFQLLMHKIETGVDLEPESDPHVVTRGSGTQPPAPAKPSKRSSNRSKSRY